MIEWCGYDSDVGPRMIFDVHDAFADLTSLQYAEPPTGCNDNTDCQSSNDTGCETSVRCSNDRCVSDHASEVASIISASKSAPSGAAKVKLFIANNDKPDTTAGYDKNYDYLLDQQVQTVNETHGGINGYDGPQVADYYAHVYGMLPVQAAGNGGPSGVACAQSANALCVGGTLELSALAMAPYSSSSNPSSSDREEPDITAFGATRPRRRASWSR